MTNRVFVLIIGGMDIELVEKFDSEVLMQSEYGDVEVDKLWDNLDVATQITSQLITGETWKESGVKGRRKYTNEKVERLEKNFFQKYKDYIPLETTLRPFREDLYNNFWYTKLNFEKRNYIQSDLECDTFFEEVENSKAVYVPAYNPEPSWAVRRNIISPEKYSDLGFEAAVDLAEKNLSWRVKKIKEEIGQDYDLFVTQIQYLDSIQHLYGLYSDERKESKIKEAYEKIEEIAKELKEIAEEKGYDKILFISDNGEALEDKGGPKQVHKRNAMYSLNKTENLQDTNMRDFYDHIKRWVVKDV